MEVPAPFAGVVKEIKIAVGDKVKTGSLIMTFEVAGAAPAAQAPAAPAASTSAAIQHLSASSKSACFCTSSKKKNLLKTKLMSMQHLLSAVLAREFGCENLAKKLKEQVVRTYLT